VGNLKFEVNKSILKGEYEGQEKVVLDIEESFKPRTETRTKNKALVGGRHRRCPDKTDMV